MENFPEEPGQGILTSLKAVFQGGKRKLEKNTQALKVATLMGAASLGAMGCTNWAATQSEPNPVEAEQKMLLQIAEDTQPPKFAISTDPVDFPMPEGLSGKMNKEDFKKKSAEITAKMVHFFQDTSSQYFTNLQNKSRGNERWQAILKIFLNGIIPIFENADPFIAEDIRKATKSASGSDKFYEFLDHFNNYLKPNGYLLLVRGIGEKTNIHLFKIGQTQTTRVDDGYFTFEINALNLDSFIGSDQNPWWKRDNGDFVTGTTNESAHEYYIFTEVIKEDVDKNYTDGQSSDENGFGLSASDYISALRVNTLHHETNHILNSQQYPLVYYNNKISCPISEQLKSNFSSEATTWLELTELSSYGAELAESRIKNGNLNQYATFDTKLQERLVPLLLPHAVLAVAPENQKKRDFITTDNFDLRNMNPSKVVRMLVQENPDFTLEHAHKVGQIMYAVAQQLQIACQVKAQEQLD